MRVKDCAIAAVAVFFCAQCAMGIAPKDLFPANGATGVNPDVQLRIGFDAPPARGAGKIQIVDGANDAVVETIDVSSEMSRQSIGGLANYNYYPITIEGNQATIHPQNGILGYGKNYYVKVEAGAFKDADEVKGAGDWHFSTKPASPDAGATKLTVAADGSGDFCTVQGAVDFVPENNTTPRTIFIRKGVYTEIVYVEKKHALHFVGEDRKQSVIGYANNAKFNSASDNHTYHRGVFLASGCDDLMIRNLTIRDTTPRGGSQAEAIILKGNTRSRAIVTGVDLYSFQDTLQINGQAYVSDCYIEGDVDFMWGTGPCFFENCKCAATRSKGYYTQIRNPASNHGYVYYHCTVDGPPGVSNVFLSRIAPDRFGASEVVLVDCVLGDAVADAGWLLNGKGDPKDVHFWEYNSHRADGTAVDVSKRLGISRQLKLPEDAEVVKQYSDPGYVLGEGWDPREVVKAAAAR